MRCGNSWVPRLKYNRYDCAPLLQYNGMTISFSKNRFMGDVAHKRVEVNDYLIPNS